MKILITGINGLLGSALAGTLAENHEVSGIDVAGAPGLHKTFEVDVTNLDDTYKTITKINPDLVIHTVAQTNVDKCETDIEGAYKLNALTARNVALACQRFDAAMLYVSTDYVFSGDDAPKDGYTEYDKPDPVSVYGKSKYEGEVYVRDLLSKYFIVRTSWLFGQARGGYVMQAAEALRLKKTVKMAADMVSSPTYAEDLSKAISILIGSSAYGLYHVTNSGFASRYEIAVEIAKMMKLPADEIGKVTLKELNLPAHRPSFSAMNNLVWKLNGHRPLRHWRDAVKEYLESKELA
ncbi:MAG: dTDP-4-dehydrorhamnose reductase [Endomicrobiales bacterium]|nr:dTDP-4-dehydrorhamnose reductase [Endomicrobiales bacterium]